MDDSAKKLLCMYAGGAAGVAAGFTAALAFSATLPVALAVTYAIGGGSILAAACMDT